MGMDCEFVLGKKKRMGNSHNFLYCTPQAFPFCLWWSLKWQLNPHLAQLGISSLYILKLMENSAAVCDNYQPAPEDRVERKGRMGGGGEVSWKRRERLKWEEDGHMKSLEKKSSFSLVSSGDTILPFLGYLLCGIRGASSRYVRPIPLLPPQDRHP